MNRHAVVVGASRGIGAAVALELGGRGWNVTGLSRAGDIPCDVTRHESVASALERATERGGPLDAVVYSAGAAVMGRTLAVPEPSAASAFDVNFWGMRRVALGAYPSLAATRGAFVAVLSIAGLRGVPFEADYAASKAACARWLDCLALEAAAEGVRVGYLAPGYIPTGFLERATWYGMAAPRVSGSGVDAASVARAVADRVEGKRARAVFGWRENAIAWADRAWPGAYDRLLRRRIAGKP